MPHSFGPKTAALVLAMGCCLVHPASAQANHPDAQAGLLFYLSGEKGATADYAANGRVEPTFCDFVERISDGTKGAALSCGHLQRLAFWGPGSIYAQRGTLSFFWRSREPVGPTEFPIFRVGFGDHSSWDMVWLRIDYNGHGFDAFVTDSSLARVRVSHRMESFPGPEQWTHIAFTWDETQGVRLYVNGKLAEKNDTPANLDTALDQFGPHSRIISPHQVQSDYNFVRGGDIDEVRIYSHALAPADVAALSSLSALPASNGPQRSLGDERWRREWWWRFGWENPEQGPPALQGSMTSVRKVEIHEAFDLKRWWWKANDGIRETTWPGVYNRSRLPGRNDYFQLPDWDCYSSSGKAISFLLPEEAWNQVEISGAASGRLLYQGAPDSKEGATLLARRVKGLERSSLRSAKELKGGVLQFSNDEPETPIGELALYRVSQEPEPAGSRNLDFSVDGENPRSNAKLKELLSYLDGRHPADERSLLVLSPDSGSASIVPGPALDSGEAAALPLVHILIPNSWDNLADGLDGIAIDLPALPLQATHAGQYPMNIQVKDPLWPMRMLCDFSFSLKPNQPHRLWLDLRDRLLPPGKSLCLSLAGAGPGLTSKALSGLKVRLVFKPAEAARAEHELDRFTQARDAYAMLVEERPAGPHMALGVRFRADLKDLLRVNPSHNLALRYGLASGVEAAKPELAIAPVPEGVPGWAFRQVQLLEYAKRFVLFYIDRRQIANGELGGGLSDDTDLVNYWPGLALMGVEPEKITQSLHRVLDACYANGMFTNGLSTIQTDELHSYEEGINSIAQIMLLEHGSPLQLERAMETARAMERVTGINAAGHRHFRSSYYSGTKMATDSVWGWSKAYNHLVLHPGMNLVEYNGNPSARKLLVEIADGLLAHRRTDERGRRTLSSAVHFETDAVGKSTRPYQPFALFWLCNKWTQDARYLEPILDAIPFSLANLNANLIDQAGWRSKWNSLVRLPADANPGTGKRRTDPRTVQGASQHFRWQIGGDKKLLENLYLSQIEISDALEYINTHGSLWTDRVGVPTTDLQRARLGGAALARNQIDAGHIVGWRFEAPASASSVAILIPDARPDSMNILVYNLESYPVKAQLTGWGIAPGLWEISQGTDTNNDDKADKELSDRKAKWERSRSLEFVFAPRATTHLRLKLAEVGTPYWERPDLGIESRDVRDVAGFLEVTVHSLGSVPSPAAKLICRSREGRELAACDVAALEAPLDLKPRTTAVRLPSSLTREACAGGSIEIQLPTGVEEITVSNNRATISP